MKNPTQMTFSSVVHFSIKLAANQIVFSHYKWNSPRAFGTPGKLPTLPTWLSSFAGEWRQCSVCSAAKLCFSRNINCPTLRESTKIKMYQQSTWLSENQINVPGVSQAAVASMQLVQYNQLKVKVKLHYNIVC